MGKNVGKKSGKKGEKNWKIEKTFFFQEIEFFYYPKTTTRVDLVGVAKISEQSELRYSRRREHKQTDKQTDRQ